MEATGGDRGDRVLGDQGVIPLAHREVTVRLADGHLAELDEEQRKAITGAVQSAIDDDALDDMKGVGGDDR